MEVAMKDTVKTLLAGHGRVVLEDAVGVISLFVLLFTVLSLPGTI
jgi:hypothetical protein